MKSRRVIALMVAAVVTMTGCTDSDTNTTTDNNYTEQVVVNEEKDEQVTVIKKEDVVEPEIDDEETKKEETESEQKDVKVSEDETSGKSENTVINGWDYPYEEIEVSLGYDKPQFDVVAQPLSLKEQYEQAVNWDQLSGFSDGQLAMLKNQGFVVMQPKGEWPNTKMHVTYEIAEYENMPVFITSDAILHMYHIFYSNSMKSMEAIVYYDKMVSLSTRMLEQSAKAYTESSVAVKEEFKYIYAYVGVGNILIKSQEFGEIGEMNKSELKEFVQEKMGTALNGEVVPEEVEQLIVEELHNIQKLAYAKSPIYGDKVDYSQYTVRGHYTTAPLFSAFFRGMMWYSQRGFQLSTGNGEDFEVNYEEVAKSLMMTHLIFEDESNVKDWASVYQLTSLYSGNSDDLNPFDLRALIKKVYGENHSFETYVDETYNEALKSNMKELRAPQINAKILSETTGEIKDIGHQFRLMGQRYNLDGHIMQELMEPTKRPLPTAFDVLSAFGHPVAEEILYDYYQTNQNWENYDQTLADMKTLKKGFNGWQDNLYNGWLWAIDAAAESFEEEKNYPWMMQSKAWSHKSLSSALGSYTQLKHNNILYAKQPVAEAGGPMYMGEHHYVEPNVELYARLLWLVTYTRENLETVVDMDRDSLQEKDGHPIDEIIDPLNEMEAMLTLLLEVSQKELAGEEITEGEFMEMAFIGGLIDYMNNIFIHQLYEKDIHVQQFDSDALIADVATNLGGAYLEEAIGLPREIYGICYVNGKSFIARGSAYSYYEFVSDYRMTDEEWNEEVGLIQEPIQGQEFTNLIYSNEKTINHLELMPWMKSYISDEPNNVEVQSVEVDWNRTQ